MTPLPAKSGGPAHVRESCPACGATVDALPTTFDEVVPPRQRKLAALIGITDAVLYVGRKLNVPEHRIDRKDDR